jgi:hypothetical protein
MVEAARGTERAPVDLRVSGMVPCRLEAAGPTGSVVVDGHNLWAATVALREQLEAEGWLLQVEGARLDVHPSGMSRDVGKAYVLRPGRRAVREDLVETLAPLSDGQAATVADQRAFFERWAASPRE